MVAKKSLALKGAATFGAAMTSLFVAPHLEADVIDLTFSPTSVGPQSTSVLVNVQINGGSVGSFSQWNDFLGATMYFNGGLSSWRTAFASETLDAGTFFGTIGNIDPLSLGGSFVAFRSGGNVGWFEIGFDGTTVTYGPGQYGSMGEDVVVGVSAQVPEPTGFGALAALALGAAGVRRNRKK